MSFYFSYQKYKNFDFDNFFTNTAIRDVKNSIYSEKLDIRKFLTLLSPEAEKSLEKMAQKSKRLTVKNFGKIILLYTPMYLANFCTNECLYCGFNTTTRIKRRKLELNEVEKEARFIAKEGLRHILILTGESRILSSVSYIKDCIKILRKYFSSITIEIYPLTSKEYENLIQEGVDGLTIYQEVYDENIYRKLHLSGPKANYRLRLDAPERAAKAGIRTITVGALLGLNAWRKEAFFTGLHAQYLQDTYPDSEISISIPRIRPNTQNFSPPYNTNAKNLVQIITAIRLFLPRVGITLSTRESAGLRDSLITLGITKISAGSTTAVGGHTTRDHQHKKTVQFEISDRRDVTQIKKMLLSKGYQPVLKDWVGNLTGNF